MAQERAHRAPRRSGQPSGSRKGTAHCLHILRQLSDYLDDDLAQDVCAEIRRHLGACPNCETFVTSLRQTISLCRQLTPKPLSVSAKAQLRRQILHAAGAR
ncbi:MAG: anti-sigma factor [Nitrospiraceae bacterium]